MDSEFDEDAYLERLQRLNKIGSWTFLVVWLLYNHVMSVVINAFFTDTAQSNFTIVLNLEICSMESRSKDFTF